MNLAIIPARGGSKRIPGKNTKLFFGQPIIRYSIQAAINSQLFDQIIVSTDSPEIAEIAVKCGAEVPFLRPPELSDDFAQTRPVILHAIQEMASRERKFTHACCILATAPFLQSRFIKDAHEMLVQSGAGALFSVTSFGYPIFRAFKKSPTGRLEYVWPEYELTRSNDLPETFHDAAQFYWWNIEKALAQDKLLFPNDTIPFVLPRYMVQDIDTPEDWEVAERAYLALVKSGEIESLKFK